MSARAARLQRRFRCIVPLLALAVAGCVSLPAQAPLDGMPIDAFVDDLKAQLRDVHWHVRGSTLGCEGSGVREVDLRDGVITVSMQRIEQVQAGASVKVVAVPLGGGIASPSLGADGSRKRTQELTLKLAVAGDAGVVDFDRAADTAAPVARAINAAIDGFMRAGGDKPCIRLTALKLELVVDVARDASGGFRVVVPALALDVGAGERRVNTLVLDWAHIESRALR